MTLKEGLKKLKAPEPAASEHSKVGTVHSMSAGYDDDGTCEMTVEHPAPKAGKGDDAPTPVAPRSTVKIPQAHASRFAIGDKVKLTTKVEPVTKGAD